MLWTPVLGYSKIRGVCFTSLLCSLKPEIRVSINSQKFYALKHVNDHLMIDIMVMQFFFSLESFLVTSKIFFIHLDCPNKYFIIRWDRFNEHICIHWELSTSHLSDIL